MVNSTIYKDSYGDEYDIHYEYWAGSPGDNDTPPEKENFLITRVCQAGDPHTDISSSIDFMDDIYEYLFTYYAKSTL